MLTMHLFAYGTLMCPEIMLRVTGSLPARLSARLEHFRRGPLAGVDYPAIVPQKNSMVTGLLYLNLAPELWNRLDEFEDKIYLRCRVNAILAHGFIMLAETYVLSPEYLEGLGEAEWSYAEFLKSGKGRFEKEYGGFPT